MATADAWARSGARPDRASIPAGPRPGRPVSADRHQRAERPPPARRSPEPTARPRAGRPRERDDDFLDTPARQPRSTAGATRSRDADTSAERDGRVRGVVAVIGMFVVTLAGAGVDSLTGIGLGLLTMAALIGVTAVAALVVRRRDLVSVVVAPPLVFVAVAFLNIGLAPSASFNLPTVATLLVRGFPTMGIATAVALVLALVRLAARR